MREAVEQVEAAVADCAVAAWALPDDEVIDCLAHVHRVEQALRAVKLRLVRELEVRDIPSARHAASLTNWLRWHLRITGSEAARLRTQARAVDQRPGLDDALASGQINTEQLASIVASLAALPDDVGQDIADAAEQMLVGWAGELDPVQLRQAGTRILAHVAPQVAEQADEAALARAERAAHRDRYLTLTPVGDGRVRLRGSLDVEAAAIVTAALDPLCAPRHHRSTPADPRLSDNDAAPAADAAAAHAPAGRAAAGNAAAGHRLVGAAAAGDQVLDERTAGQRRADALVDICRLALNTGELPVNGGDRPQVVVIAPFDVLHQKVGAGELDTGGQLSAERVRQLACDAQITPAVLGGKGQVLDLGRTRRLATGPLRRAVVIRDRGCTFPGCDRAPRWCDTHHLTSWFDGGRTDLSNLALMCRYHHHLIHSGDWRVRIGADDHPEFIPPTYVDPQQIPRRNPYHRRT